MQLADEACSIMLNYSDRDGIELTAVCRAGAL